MTVKEIAQIIEQFAPLSLQASFDNSGLNLGRPEASVRGIMLCVDVTESVLEEAIAKDANLIISHHPLLFHPLSQITMSNATERIVEKALIAGVALYAAHTNLDSTSDGMSWFLGRLLGLQAMRVLCPNPENRATGYGVVGELACGPIPPADFLQQVKQTLRCGAIRHSTLCRESVSKIALLTGSGASSLEDAVTAGADLYITADLKYNDFYAPDSRIIVADVGHFESEYCAIDLLFDIIRKKIATFAVHKSEHVSNPVNYLV